MPRYFQNMPTVGKAVRANPENVAELKAIEEDIHAQIVKGLENGKADEAMNARGQLTAMQRVTLLVDPGTWCPPRAWAASTASGAASSLPITRSTPAPGCPARPTTCSGAATPPSGCASP